MTQAFDSERAHVSGCHGAACSWLRGRARATERNAAHSHGRVADLRLVSVLIVVPLGTREFLSPPPMAIAGRVGGRSDAPPNKNCTTDCVVTAGSLKYSELSTTMTRFAVKAVRNGSSWYAYSPRSSSDLFRRYLQAPGGHGHEPGQLQARRAHVGGPRSNRLSAKQSSRHPCTDVGQCTVQHWARHVHVLCMLTGHTLCPAASACMPGVGMHRRPS